MKRSEAWTATHFCTCRSAVPEQCALPVGFRQSNGWAAAAISVPASGVSTSRTGSQCWTGTSNELAPLHTVPSVPLWAFDSACLLIEHDVNLLCTLVSISHRTTRRMCKGINLPASSTMIDRLGAHSSDSVASVGSPDTDFLERQLPWHVKASPRGTRENSPTSCRMSAIAMILHATCTPFCPLIIPDD